MTLRLFMGSKADIEGRFSAAPSPFNAQVLSIDGNVLTLSTATGLSVNDALVVRQRRVRVVSLAASAVEVSTIPEGVTVGDTVTRFDADFTPWRVGEGKAPDPLSFVDDREKPKGGDGFGRPIVLTDYTGTMVKPSEGWRLCIFDDVVPNTVLFSGVIARVELVPQIIQTGRVYWSYGLDVRGWQEEADSLLINEPPFVNINSGRFLRLLMTKYTTLEVGQIDEAESPTLGRVRLQRGRRFSEVLQELNNLWPDGEAFIEYGRGTGLVYFRKRTSSPVPFILDVPKMTQWGPKKFSVERDASKTFNMLELPFWLVRDREPEVFTQPTVSDPAFLQTSVLLSGVPSNVEETDLITDDFSRDGFIAEWVEYDKINPTPPRPFSPSDGYIIAGRLNDVPGCHLLPAPSAALGDLGVTTNAIEIEPWTGEEKQLLYAQEVVINALGDAVLFAIVDQTTLSQTVRPSSTTTAVNVDSTAGFSVGDRVTWDAFTAYVTDKDAETLFIAPAFPIPPNVGTQITLHPLALSRVLAGLKFSASGALTLIRDGVEEAFSPARTYTAPATYSVRYYMQAFETTVTSATDTTATLANSANFNLGDWIEVYTRGRRTAPELRQITAKVGDVISYAATTATPSAGYQVRTLPKLVIQIKGGAYGDINGRNWTTVYTAPNTWKTDHARDAYGVTLALQQSLTATIPLFQVKNPISVTAMVGGRYLHIGTQEVDSSEPDIDCILRRVGSKYQIDFFPDTKTLWGSGNRLIVAYKERYKYTMRKSDPPAIAAMADYRGHVLSGQESLQELARLGGRYLERLEFSDNPMTLQEARDLCRNVLEAVKDIAVKVTIQTNSYLDPIVKAGQTIQTTLEGAPLLQVEQVEVTEIPGVKDETGRTVFQMQITAGTVDRLQLLTSRQNFKAGARLSLVDPANGDSESPLQELNFFEAVTSQETLITASCSNRTRKMFGNKMRCLIIA